MNHEYVSVCESGSIAFEAIDETSEIHMVKSN